MWRFIAVEPGATRLAWAESVPAADRAGTTSAGENVVNDGPQFGFDQLVDELRAGWPTEFAGAGIDASGQRWVGFRNRMPTGSAKVISRYQWPVVIREFMG